MTDIEIDGRVVIVAVNEMRAMSDLHKLFPTSSLSMPAHQDIDNDSQNDEDGFEEIEYDSLSIHVG